MCDFLRGYFHCALQEDTMGVEVTVRTIGGILNFLKDFTTQSSTCRPLSKQVQMFPSLLKKIEAFIEEQQKVANPFTPV